MWLMSLLLNEYSNYIFFWMIGSDDVGKIYIEKIVVILTSLLE